MKCALPECDKEASYRTLCCCIAHSRRFGGLVSKGFLPKLEKPKVALIKREPGRKPPKQYKDRSPESQAKWISYLAERRKKRDKSCPPWADKNKIQEIYIEAKRLTQETGIPHEVDHIIPSTHPLVCGLHVETNLQVLTKSDNRKKFNNFQIWKD